MRFRRQCKDLFKVLKKKDYQARILYPAKLPFKIREEITFLDKNERTHHQSVSENTKESHSAPEIKGY